MGKIISVFKRFTWRTYSILGIVTFTLAAIVRYNMTMGKLAEAKYAERVRNETITIEKKYDDVEDEITQRKIDTIKWSNKVKDEVDKEVKQYEDSNSSSSYSFTASDVNDSVHK